MFDLCIQIRDFQCLLIHLIQSVILYRTCLFHPYSEHIFTVQNVSQLKPDDKKKVLKRKQNRKNFSPQNHRGTVFGARRSLKFCSGHLEVVSPRSHLDFTFPDFNSNPSLLAAAAAGRLRFWWWLGL